MRAVQGEEFSVPGELGKPSKGEEAKLAYLALPGFEICTELSNGNAMQKRRLPHV